MNEYGEMPQPFVTTTNKLTMNETSVVLLLTQLPLSHFLRHFQTFQEITQPYHIWTCKQDVSIDHMIFININNPSVAMKLF